MTFHAVNGDRGAALLMAALELPPEDIHVHRDDLAFGPLHDVDEVQPGQRAAFWREAAGVHYMRDFDHDLARESAKHAKLKTAGRPVCIWHGQSSSDELMLRRMAAYLSGSGCTISEVLLTAEYLHEAPFGDKTSIGLYLPAELRRAALSTRAVTERQLLVWAAEWRTYKNESADVRFWLADETDANHRQFHGVPFDAIDLVILRHLPVEWEPVATTLRRSMSLIDGGLFATDLIVWWRMRELAIHAALQVRGNVFNLTELEIRAGQFQ
jgi:Domain of unknown function (DUF1835)/Protein of unknown function